MHTHVNGVQRKEGADASTLFFEVANTLTGRLFAVDHYGVQESTHRHCHGNIVLALRRPAQVNETTMYTCTHKDRLE